MKFETYLRTASIVK